MSHRSRYAFTLVELLVVVVIIGMLMALLVPAVVGARESARKAKCMNNQKELGLAVLQYENAKQRFPGYVNRTFDEEPGPLSWSWVVVVFQYLGREDLWREWRAGNEVRVRLDQLVCPSDLEWENMPTRLSYVANCGMWDGQDPQVRAAGQSMRFGNGDIPPDFPRNGVFHNHDLPQKNTPPPYGPVVQVSLDYISMNDGCQNTLLLSESISDGNWTDREEGLLPPSNNFPWGVRVEAKLGFMWRLARDPSELDAWRINDAPPPVPPAVPPPEPPYPGNVSSNHPGGVIVTFCDGHQHFLRDDIHYRVYQHLMTPNSRKAGVQGTLSEGDY